MFLQSPIQLAHFYWEQILEPGDQVLDATCGQGKDSLFLAQKTLREDSGELYALDIQKEALEKTKAYLEGHLAPMLWNRIHYIHSCHSELDSFEKEAFKLITYNLGYLPGSDKELTTLLDSSIKSFEKALGLLKKGAYLSITCYPGHENGRVEKEGVLKWAKGLDRSFHLCHHEWMNRSDSAPSLLLIQKN